MVLAEGVHYRRLPFDACKRDSISTDRADLFCQILGPYFYMNLNICTENNLAAWGLSNVRLGHDRLTPWMLDTNAQRKPVLTSAVCLL